MICGQAYAPHGIDRAGFNQHPFTGAQQEVAQCRCLAEFCVIPLFDNPLPIGFPSLSIEAAHFAAYALHRIGMGRQQHALIGRLVAEQQGLLCHHVMFGSGIVYAADREGGGKPLAQAALVYCLRRRRRVSPKQQKFRRGAALYQFDQVSEINYGRGRHIRSILNTFGKFRLMMAGRIGVVGTTMKSNRNIGAPWRWAASMLLAVSLAAHGEAKLYGLETGIYCAADGAGAKGLACDVMAEVARRAGHSGAVEVLPVARAQEVLRVPGNFFITPMVKDPALEKVNYFFAKIVDDEFVFIGVQGGKVDISSIDSAKHLNIGVLRASSAIPIAKAHGINQFEEVAQQELNAKKLLSGRIDAWLSSWNGARAAAKLAGLDPAMLRKGAVLGTVSFYLAASIGIDKAELAKWQAAFEAMRKDGTLAGILKKYDWQ